MRYYLLLFLVATLSVCIGQKMDSVSASKIKGNLNIGSGLTKYRLEYDVHDSNNFSLLHSKSYSKQFYYLSFGASFAISNLKFNVDLINLKMWNFQVGYNLFSFFKRIDHIHKLNFSLNYGVLTTRNWSKWHKSAQLIKDHPDSFFPLSYQTTMIGSSLSYQFNKMEIVYSFLQYRRAITLNSIEQQHLFGLRYNFF